MKVKKQHRKKKFLHKLNRKRMFRKLRNTGEVQCKVINEAWSNRKSSVSNLASMGLVGDPNKTIKIPNYKEEKLKMLKRVPKDEIMVKEENSDVEQEVKTVAPKTVIAQKLEMEAKAPRERKFMLPKGQVEFLSYLLDKYGHDYKAMAKDKKNYYQETWKQLRAKIKTFMGIPKQYGAYLQTRGLLDKEENEDELKIQAQALVMDDSD